MQELAAVALADGVSDLAAAFAGIEAEVEEATPLSTEARRVCRTSTLACMIWLCMIAFARAAVACVAPAGLPLF